MIDNNSARDGSFSFPDADNGVARACLISVKQTEYKKISLVAASLKWVKKVFSHVVQEYLNTSDYKNNSLHLARKYARIFVRGHYLFREANSFPRAKLEEQIMSKDKYPSIFLQPNWGYSIYYPSVLKIGEYPRIFPSFSWGIFAHVTRLDQSSVSENIWWIINLYIHIFTFSLV